MVKITKEDFASDLLQSNKYRVHSPRFWGILASLCSSTSRNGLLATEGCIRDCGKCWGCCSFTSLVVVPEL